MIKKQGCDFLCFDISNLLHRTFFAQTNENDETLAGMASHMALTTLNKYYKQFKPRKKVVMCFDRSSWRKEYTSERPFLKPYKGNRRKDMTPAQQAKYERFLSHLAEFESLIIQHTTIVALVGEGLEADDLLAGFVQMHPNDEIIIISTDSDLAQLLKHANVRLISPAIDSDQKTLDKFDGDPDYYLFQKCVRGDITDNIQSAYPRVRSTRIKEIYENAVDGDGYKFVNFMKETWTDHMKRTFTVEEMFRHNQTLIDLEKQPSEIRELITATLEEELNMKKQFSYFHILKFIGKYELVKIKENIENFIPLLSS